jgi:hypothetical protein
VAVGVGVEVGRLDLQGGRIEPIEGIGEIYDRREPRGSCRAEEPPVLGRLDDPADPGNQHPDARHASSPAVGRDGPIDLCHELPAKRPEHVRAVLARRARPDAGPRQDVAV